MNNLTINELEELKKLVSQLRSRKASGAEMRHFLSLIQRSGSDNQYELQEYLYASGYAGVDDLEHHLNEKLNQEFVEGLAKIGIAILIAYGLAKLLRER